MLSLQSHLQMNRLQSLLGLLCNYYRSCKILWVVKELKYYSCDPINDVGQAMALEAMLLKKQHHKPREVG